MNVSTILSTCLLCFCIVQYSYCSARDTITSLSPLMRDTGENISSAGNKFQLGFFTPGGGEHYLGYIGIWYSIDPSTLVWVANRHRPLMTAGMFSLEKDGNLKVLDTNRTSNYFTTNLTSLGPARPLTRTARLLDSGNLVLVDDITGKTLWQSFDNPTDTFLPGMKMDENFKLISWIESGDPDNGKYWFQKDEDDYVILKQIQHYQEGVTVPKTREYWKSRGNLTSSFNTNKMDKSIVFLLSNLGPFNVTDGDFDNSRLVLDYSGKLKYLSWNDSKNTWDLNWSEPQVKCDLYNVCGDFGSCSITEGSYLCNCLPGFEPSSPDYWKVKDFALSGCSRKSKMCSKHWGNDTFLDLKVFKVGDPKLPPYKTENEQDCRGKCLDNCECQAYLYMNDSLIGGQDRRNLCWIWTVNVTDIQEANTHDAYHLFIRVARDGSQRKSKMSLLLILILVCTSATVGILLFCCIKYLFHRRIVTNRRVSINANTAVRVDSRRLVEDVIINQDQFREDENEAIDVPFFDLGSILAATNNFSEANKLGQGGFGAVYKAKFWGEELAVKRLLCHSVQGLQEFKNEVVLIAKLQHRNLVKLLGYCTEGNEKILLYEYMPNKSLDAFIFDEKLCGLLDWEKRFDIIWGVARGLLYLHQDSRLRVIHRDMKVSNILLDEEMNPKISDFGLARIVGGRETEVSTNRVVGTYGYMSPEYALDGQFSVKSDVFSFGVVLLEIISEKRNSGFYKSQLAGNLLAYAWSLWKEEKALVLLGQTLEESCINRSEALKCIIVGLLCVQEDPDDRPTMSKVLFMLGSEIATLPNPKQPAFFSNKLPPQLTFSK